MAIWDEMQKYLETLSEFTQVMLDFRTYFGDLDPSEIADFFEILTRAYYKLLQLNAETYFKLISQLPKGDVEEFLKIYLEYIPKLEDIFAEISDNPVYSAYVNVLNRFYLKYLKSIQNFNSAILHSLGLVSRRDIIALSEAYVDLKGDIKRETRRILREVRELKEEIKKKEERKEEVKPSA